MTCWLTWLRKAVLPHQAYVISPDKAVGAGAAADVLGAAELLAGATALVGLVGAAGLLQPASASATATIHPILT
jgi:hypothetical protein